MHEFDGYRTFIPTNDHRPAHVHVAKAGNEAIFFLNCPSYPVVLRENFGFKRAHIAVIERELNSMAGALCARWEAIHGQP